MLMPGLGPGQRLGLRGWAEGRKRPENGTRKHRKKPTRKCQKWAPKVSPGWDCQGAKILKLLWFPLQRGSQRGSKKGTQNTSQKGYIKVPEMGPKSEPRMGLPRGQNALNYCGFRSKGDPKGDPKTVPKTPPKMPT